MSYRISTAKMWSASWDNLCRLAKSLGIKVRPGPELDRRGLLIKKIQYRIDEIDLDWAVNKRKKKNEIVQFDASS